MNCKKCGAPLDSNTKFCGSCGTPNEPQNEAVNSAPDIFNMKQPVEPQPMPNIQPQQPVEPQPMPNTQPQQPIEPQPMPSIQSQQLVEPQPASNPQIQQLAQLQNNQNQSSGIIPPITQQNIPENNSDERKEKKSVLPIILVLLILLGVGAICAYKFLLNKPDKIVTGLINKAYDKFEAPLKETKKYENNGESVLITTDLSVNTNIEGLEDLNSLKLKFITGTDYTNKKFELGASFLEDDTDIIEVFMYLINNKAYAMLKDIYENPIEINAEGINIEELFKNNKYSAEDTEFIAKEFKNILINSLDMNDFKQTKDTITLNNKEEKVTKINYILNDTKARKIVNNFIDNTLKNEALLNKLAEMSEIDLETLKDNLQQSKIESDENILDGEVITFNIYTKGLTEEFVGMDIEMPENSNMKIRKADDTTIISTNISGISTTFTIKSENKDKCTIDVKMTVAGEEITGLITIENKQIDEKNSESNMTFNINYQQQTVNLALNMKEQIGANIADIDITNAKPSEEITEEEITQIEQKLMEKLMNSKLYNLISGLTESNYDYDYDYNAYNQTNGTL